MLRTVTDEAALRRGQKALAQCLRSSLPEKVPVYLGHPGGKLRLQVHWLAPLGIWFYTRKMENRYWNAFGAGKPHPGETIPITCEINFPLKGIDRRLGGALAQDLRGQVFVLHRGKLGGKKGEGKRLFTQYYRGVWSIVDDGNASCQAAVIGPLPSPLLAREIALFVHKIDRIKTQEANPAAQLDFFSGQGFHAHLVGAVHEPAGDLLTSACYHGLVVTALARALGPWCRVVTNDSWVDLRAQTLRAEGDLAFVVPENASRTCLEAAMARLLFSGSQAEPNTRRFVVLPHPIDCVLEQTLDRLQISVLHYEWQGDQISFPDLSDHIHRSSPLPSPPR